MLVCDRCEGKNSVVGIQCISAKMGNQNNIIVDKCVDLCVTCMDSLKKEIQKYIQPLDKAKAK